MLKHMLSMSTRSHHSFSDYCTVSAAALNALVKTLRSGYATSSCDFCLIKLFHTSAVKIATVRSRQRLLQYSEEQNQMRVRDEEKKTERKKVK